MLARILIVDDYEPFRKQLRRLVESQPDWQVCCEAADGCEAVAKHPQVRPNVTIMDFNMPVVDGLKASRRIIGHDPDAAILMVTVFASIQLEDEAKRAGVRGFCAKTEANCIIQAIETLLRGETYFSHIN